MYLSPMLPLLFFATQVLANDYVIDPARTSVEFRITALGLIEQEGRFDRVRGMVKLDEAQGTGEIRIEIDADSINTGLTFRDRDFRGERWFDTERYPTLVFHGKRFLFSGGRLTAIEGTLTMRGVRQALRFEVGHFACNARADGHGADVKLRAPTPRPLLPLAGQEREEETGPGETAFRDPDRRAASIVCLARASAALQRSRFGMDSYSLLVGDEVRLQVQVEAVSAPVSRE